MNKKGIYLEVMSEMSNPKHFSRSLSVTTAAMALIYCGTSAPLYIRYGSTVAGEVLYGLSDGWMRTVAGAAMFLHVCVSYIISSQLVNRAIHVRLAPQVVGAGGRVEATQWLCISTATAVAAWLLANIIPFFAQLLGILASFCMAPLAFGFPAFFYLIAGEYTLGRAGRGRGLTESSAEAGPVGNAGREASALLHTGPHRRAGVRRRRDQH